MFYQHCPNHPGAVPHHYVPGWHCYHTVCDICGNRTHTNATPMSFPNTVRFVRIMNKANMRKRSWAYAE